MKTENYTGIGAILSSLFIASCCIGPAIFVIFGTSLGFMGWLSGFEPYQRYFMALAAFLLSVSFWKLYLKNSDCEEGDTRINAVSKVIFWIGFAFFIFAISFPRILLLIYS